MRPDGRVQLPPPPKHPPPTVAALPVKRVRLVWTRKSVSWREVRLDSVRGRLLGEYSDRHGFLPSSGMPRLVSVAPPVGVSSVLGRWESVRRSIAAQIGKERCPQRR